MRTLRFVNTKTTTVLSLIILMAATTAHAAKRKLPYKATIIKSDAFARSGPGRRYYPTSRFRKGQQVVVRRHDPGGWYMIEPPAGSFSWIRAEYVQRKAGNRGVVSENGIVVRVGSQFGDNHNIEQRRLSIGDDVTILGEKSLNSDGRSIRMFKIKPPVGEYRWIKGDAVLAEGESPRKLPSNEPFVAQDDKDSSLGSGPFRDPVSTTEKKRIDPFDESENSVADKKFESPRPNTDLNSNDKGTLKKRPVVRTKRPADPSKPSSYVPVIADHQRLDQLDAMFRTIIKRDTGDWSFTQLERDYRDLQDATESPVLAREVDRRLAAIVRYQKIKTEYDEFVRLTSETDQRDAQLLSLRRQEEQKKTSASSTMVRRKLNAPDPRTTSPRPRANPKKKPATRNTPKFTGAGIVQRSATTFRGAPRHVLLAPNGRILAYLISQKRADGKAINLDRFLGRSMGIVGSRTFRRELQTDLIIVHEMSPVHLKPQAR